MSDVSKMSDHLAHDIFISVSFELFLYSWIASLDDIQWRELFFWECRGGMGRLQWDGYSEAYVSST